jgi:hypothetical protein
MFTMSIVARKSSHWIAGLTFLAFLLLPPAARSQQFADCASALQVSGGAVALADGTTTTSTKGVDEWEGNILKIGVSRPGVLILSGEGISVQASLYAGDPASGSPLLLDSGPAGSAHRPLTAVVGPGEHCIGITPPAGATGDLRVRATFFDVCHLGPQDDHGDSFLCATEIGPGESRTGEIATADQDLFTFVLTTSRSVTVTMAGAASLAASLQSEDGTLLAADGRGTRTLSAGRYFVRIEGTNGGQGSYEVGLAVDQP